MPSRSISIPKYTTVATTPENTPGDRTAIMGRDGDGNENPRHKRLVDHVRRLIDLSERNVSSRWTQWQEIDRRLRCYVDPSEFDRVTGRQLRPHDVKVVLPISYAIHQNQVAYTYTIMTSQTPIFPLEARKPDDVFAAQIMEELLQYDIDRDNGRLTLFNWIHDITKYGLGCAQDEWIEVWQKRTFRESEPVELFGMPMGSRTTESRRWVRIKNGNHTENIDPYMYIMDPRVPAGRVQEGDYVGYAWFRSWQSLKQAEKDGRYENVDYIEPWARERAGSAFQQSVRYDTLGFPATWDQSLGEDDRGYVAGHTIWLRIVPSDFDLAGDESEIWVVTVANYNTCIRVERWDYDHGEFPVSVGEYHFDGYSPYNQGATEVFQPLQDLADWFAGAHMDNIKKVLNDMFVIDPSKLNLNDLRTPGPGKWMRLLPSAWGKGTEGAITQLKVQDVTAQFVGDVSSLQQMMTQASASINPDMGIKSATKSRATVFAGLMQLAQMRGKVIAQIMSTQGIRRWVSHLVSNLQQFLDEETFVKITGDKAQKMNLDPYKSHLIDVSPEDIQGQFDFPIHTGDLPPDPARNVQTWAQVMMAVAQNQMLAQRFNLVEIFKQLIYAAGIKNVEPFLVQTQMQPDEEVMKQAQAGNLVPMTGTGGAQAPLMRPPQPTLGRPQPAAQGASLGAMLMPRNGQLM